MRSDQKLTKALSEGVKEIQNSDSNEQRIEKLVIKHLHEVQEKLNKSIEDKIKSLKPSFYDQKYPSIIKQYMKAKCVLNTKEEFYYEFFPSLFTTD